MKRSPRFFNLSISWNRLKRPSFQDDAAWILSNGLRAISYAPVIPKPTTDPIFTAFLILTMQTGFGMLEAGTVSSKNIANIMIKNVVDVSIGGLAYWSFGYGLSFGDEGNAFVGFGEFFVTSKDTRTMGTFYAKYMFQFSFATAATTIVSGAVAERIKLEAYMIYSFLNVFVYCLPACWAWSSLGWLGRLGFYDFAGACIVHMNGGASALVSALMLGPRHGRFERPQEYGMSSPVTALTGTFMLWWAWLAFNCGSTFGISGVSWKTATKVAVNTINGSIGGSLAGLILSVALTWRRGKYIDIPIVICSVLGGLVGITCGCSLYTPGESILIGLVGGMIGVLLMPVMEVLRIDDPVGAVPVHLGAATWSTLAVGIFGRDEFSLLKGHSGLAQGGGFYLLGVQALGCVVVVAWAMVTTWISFFLIDRTIGIRMDLAHEIHGADWVEHRVKSESFADKMEKAIEKLRHDGVDHTADGEYLINILLGLMKTPEAQGSVSGVIHNFGGAGQRSGTIAAVAHVVGDHRRNSHSITARQAQQAHLTDKEARDAHITMYANADDAENGYTHSNGANRPLSTNGVIASSQSRPPTPQKGILHRLKRVKIRPNNDSAQQRF